MTHISIDNFWAFVGGGISAVGAMLYQSGSHTFNQVNFHEFIVMAPWKVLVTAIAAFVGGILGVLGKMFINYIIKKIKGK